MGLRRASRLVSRLAALVLSASLAPVPALALDGSLDFGTSKFDTSIEGLEFEMYTYRPEGCAKPSVLLVFHGNGRGARSYRNSARPIARDGCFVVYAPLFDRERFPSWSYHRGGVVHDGELRNPRSWTVNLVEDLADWVRRREGEDVPIYMFGHSAGGQFLSRVAAYALPDNVERIVIANPSTYVMPTEEIDAPYGYGELPDKLVGEAEMRAYLAAPITIYLGREDVGSKQLTRNEEADKLGDTRLERGRTAFARARRMAEERGWPFGWSLVEAPGVGHSAQAMLGAEEMYEALGFDLQELSGANDSR